MEKQLQLIMSAIFMVLAGFSGYGQSVGDQFNDDDITYEITSTAPAEVKIMDYNGTATEVDIPPTVNNSGTDYNVTAIGEDNDANNSKQPFGNKGLNRVTIPNTVIIIGLGAFNRNALTEVTIPESVTTIRKWAFATNDLTGELTIPASVESIGEQAFYNNNNLSAVTVRQNPPATTVHATAFDNQASNRIVFDLVVPFGSIQAYENSDWVGFAKTITYGVAKVDGITYAIIDASGEATVIHGSNLNPVILEEVDIDGHSRPVQVTAVGDNAFDTRDIQTIVLPETIKSIGPRAFYSRHIFRVIVMADEPPAIDPDAFQYPYRHGMIDVFVPRDRVQDYIDAGWIGFRSVSTLEGRIHNSEGFIWEVTSVNPNEVELVRFIGLLDDGPRSVSLEEMFGTEGHVEIPTEIAYLPNSQNDNMYTVTSIGDDVFDRGGYNGIIYWDYYHDPLKSIDIPDTVTQIGDCAFCGNELVSIAIPGSVESIGNNAFSDNDLTSVEIPNSVTHVGESAFAQNQLASVTTRGNVEYFGDGAFSNNQLTSVIIPSNVKTIKEFTYSSNKLTEVTIPNSVERIDSHVFYNNPDLALVTVEANDPPVLDPTAFANANRHQIDLVVSKGKIQAYKDNGWGGFRSISADGPSQLIVDFNRGFSPNGDGIADTLVIKGLEKYGNNVVKIYNLNQQLLFSAHYGGPGDGWDGTKSGGRVPVGSYVCIIDYNEPGLDHETKMIYVNY